MAWKFPFRATVKVSSTRGPRTDQAGPTPRGAPLPRSVLASHARRPPSAAPAAPQGRGARRPGPPLLPRRVPLSRPAGPHAASEGLRFAAAPGRGGPGRGGRPAGVLTPSPPGWRGAPAALRLRGGASAAPTCALPPRPRTSEPLQGALPGRAVAQHRPQAAEQRARLQALAERLEGAAAGQHLVLRPALRCARAGLRALGHLGAPGCAPKDRG